ncbi:hypothetical protein [Actinomadura soli]|uniref:hypothetical protein n=1 Tax=Actinomadura soli TaxID=2508997 RepID=UPI001485E102|nr:hypothetical protein [Actinomadura soli]
MHWWSQQAFDAAAEAQAADPSAGNLMAAAQVQALVSLAEALHRIASVLEERDGPENVQPPSTSHSRSAHSRAAATRSAAAQSAATRSAAAQSATAPTARDRQAKKGSVPVRPEQ